MTVALRLQRKDDDAVDRIYDAESEQQALALIVEARYRNMLRAMNSVIADALDIDPEDFRLDDATTREMLDYAAERVVRIDQTTREALRELLKRGQEMGLSNYELAHGTSDGRFGGVEHLFSETWAGRADLISRTELAEAQRASAVSRYRDSGLVDRVKIVDGDYDAVCASRNGRTVPLADAPGLAHPACRLVLIPVLREGVV